MTERLCRVVGRWNNICETAFPFEFSYFFLTNGEYFSKITIKTSKKIYISLPFKFLYSLINFYLLNLFRITYYFFLSVGFLCFVKFFFLAKHDDDLSKIKNYNKIVSKLPAKIPYTFALSKRNGLTWTMGR